MIDEGTPYKMVEIIHDTWPQLYYLKKTTMTFTVYSKDGCPYCTKVQQVLELAEVKHVIYKLNRDYTREEFYDKFGKVLPSQELSKMKNSLVDVPKLLSI